MTKATPSHKCLRYLPKVGDGLLWKGNPVIVLDVFRNGNFASTIAIQDKRKRVYEVHKEELFRN